MQISNESIKLPEVVSFSPVQYGLFRDCSPMGGGGGKRHHLSKICHTYSTLMKLGRVIPLEFLKVVLVNMVELLLMSAGLATLVFLKIKVF